ncbi:MAG: hypothetical protein M0C28_07540 [Candidatus Moduliflexus flocculans]|nr:hypothetical protein [Candidatus Moduliflexus flocculans]
MPFGFRANALSRRADAITDHLPADPGRRLRPARRPSPAGTPTPLIGASREMMTMIMVEPVLAMTLILGAVQTVTSLGHGLGRSRRDRRAAYGASRGHHARRLPAGPAGLRRPGSRSTSPRPRSRSWRGPSSSTAARTTRCSSIYMMLKQMFYACALRRGLRPVRPDRASTALDILLQLPVVALVVFVVIAPGRVDQPARCRIDQAVKYLRRPDPRRCPWWPSGCAVDGSLN